MRGKRALRIDLNDLEIVFGRFRVSLLLVFAVADDVSRLGDPLILGIGGNEQAQGRSGFHKIAVLVKGFASVEFIGDGFGRSFGGGCGAIRCGERTLGKRGLALCFLGNKIGIGGGQQIDGTIWCGVCGLCRRFLSGRLGAERFGGARCIRIEIRIKNVRALLRFSESYGLAGGF